MKKKAKEFLDDWASRQFSEVEKPNIKITWRWYKNWLLGEVGYDLASVLRIENLAEFATKKTKKYKLKLKKIVKHTPYVTTKDEMRFSATAHYAIEKFKRGPSEFKIRLGSDKEQPNKQNAPEVWIILKHKKKQKKKARAKK